LVQQNIYKPTPHHGHQDNTVDWDKLSFPAILNITADEQATRQRNIMLLPTTDVRNIARVQLRINDIAITRDSQQWILKEAGRIPIEQYYRDKIGWSTKVFDSIQWDIQRTVLNTFNSTDQTRLIKFIHGWLPTQKRLHLDGSARSPRCPLCKNLLEDNIHLLQCTHSKMQNTQRQIPNYLAKSLHNHGNSEITNLIEIGLLESTHYEWTADESFVSMEWKNGIREQNAIGWVHLYRGRISRSLIKAMDKHYTTMGLNKMTHNGTRWARQLLTNIWKTILDLWCTRLEIIHDKESDLRTMLLKEKIKTRIQKCYEFRDKLSAKERLQWFSADIEELLQQDHKFLDSWAKIVERLIRITRREQKARPADSMIMERFLNINTTRPAGRLRQHLYPRHFPSDMNPD
jgi:hypothetical protein